MILEIQNKTGEAQKRYEAIVSTNQRAPVAANNLAWIYADNDGNLDVALQLAQAAKSQLPAIPEVNDTLGWVYYKKGLPALAIPPLQESVAKDPDNPIYRLHLGLAYARAGQKEKARTDLERAIQINPKFDGADVARQTLLALK
jgi:tetratricopeptide (TPR) repeat protein